ncbi:MAG: tandem-95 repeat protein [bacterium]|nr:tandem-95 repeat protein [bacterium]
MPTLTTEKPDKVFSALRVVPGNVKTSAVKTCSIIIFFIVGLVILGLPTIVPFSNMAFARVFTVNQTSDGGDASLADNECDCQPATPGPQCSLRAAIQQANYNSDEDFIEFDIPGTGPHKISPASSLPDIEHRLFINGYSQPGAQKNSNPVGSGTNAVLMIELDGSNAGIGVNGLTIKAGACEIKGLVINNFIEAASGTCQAHGIVLDVNGGNIITGNFIGTDVTGLSAKPNQGSGIAIFDLSGSWSCTLNVIGGTVPEDMNLISGNWGVGVQVSEDCGGRNTIQGNLIGTDKTGMAALGNGKNGVYLYDSHNTIGGSSAGARNIISGNQWPGIIIEQDSSYNEIKGNFIGTDITGASALGNLNGIVINNSSHNTIGGVTAADRNIISGSTETGLKIEGTAAADNTVQGNYIGTNSSGNSAIANSHFGILLDGAPNNTIGGTASGAGNVISGNTHSGILISGADASGNKVLGNYIGIDASGGSTLPNDYNGVHILQAPDNIIGGTTVSARNVISGNDDEGVAIAGIGATGNYVQGNFIGLDATGQSYLSNLDGVVIQNASGNTIGGDTAEAGNVISGNTQYGIWIRENGASLNTVQANIIGSDNTVTQSGLGNDFSGICLDNAPSNLIGGLTPDAGNWISGNGENGIFIIGNDATLNKIQGNYIGTNAAGDAALANHISGINIENAPLNTIGGTTPAARNIISGNTESGILIYQSGAAQNLVQGNYIGTNAAGDAALANHHFGVRILDAPQNTIGGTSSAEGNVISGNAVSGIQIYQSGAAQNIVQGNYIGTNAAGDTALANMRCGVHILEAPDNLIGGSSSGAGNIISGNDDEGIGIAGSSATGNEIKGNVIGLDITGTSVLANKRGMAITIATGNMIGGIIPEERNVISGNTEDGIRIEGSTTSSNIVQGNYIGTDPGGSLSGFGNGENGIIIYGAPGNTVGGTASGCHNVISANKKSGVHIEGSGASLNEILGNYIGTNAAGDAALANTHFGIRIVNAPQNTIGGTSTAAKNIISGNSESGIQMYQSGASLNLVQGNYIGTNAAGDAALANMRCGIHILEAPNNTIGGPGSGEGNIISGNASEGIGLAGSSATGNKIQGNVIGLDKNGQQTLANDRGIGIFNASATVIGGTATGEGNVISGNTQSGVRIDGGSSFSSKVQGNVIGTNFSGNTSGLGNEESGVKITGGAHSNTIGGTASGAVNIISGNMEHGVAIESASYSNKVTGNIIGPDINGLVSGLGNGKNGVYIDGATNNTIGGTKVEARNLISGNTENGVQIYGVGATANKIQGNYIGTIVTGGSALSNLLHGISINGASTNTIGGSAVGAGNLISGNAYSGIAIVGSGASDNDVQGNFIGLQSDGVSLLGNGANGITIEGAMDNTIGGSSSGEGNTIAYNGEDGVTIASGTGNTIDSNSIYSNTGLGIDLGDNGVTANDINDTDSGANNLQNFPVLASVTSGSWGTRIKGDLDSQVITAFNLQFFSDSTCDSSTYGEGKSLVHTTNRMAGNIDITLATTIAQGQYITATTTDNQGNTSEFSKCVLVIRDTDGDGVPDSVEAGAPNNGDGNNDGIADSQQAHVASFRNSVDGGYVTLATTNGFMLVDVQATGNPSPGDTPAGVVFPLGFFKFTVVTLPLTGASFTVDLFLPSGVVLNEYYKYGSTPGNSSNHWYNFSYDGTTGTQFSTNKMSFFFQDGQRGDDDLISNGYVVDPGGPAFHNTPPQAGDDSYDVSADNTLTIAAPGVLNNDTDADNDDLTVVLESDVSSGTLNLNSDGSFTYEPDTGFSGTDSFDYQAYDGFDYSNTVTVTITVKSTDTDGDGVPDSEEAGGPNNGDGNNDGIADSQQPHVASVQNSVDGGYVTLVTTSGFMLVDVQATGNPSPGDTPAGAVFPLGFFKFKVVTLPLTGATVKVDLFLPSGVVLNEYYKYGPTPADSSNHWYTFSYNSTTGVQFSSSKLTFFFQDCHRGDSALFSNGYIIDPGGPAFCNTPPVAANDSYFIPADTSLTITAPGILTNDTDIDSDDLSVTLETDVAHGSLSLNSDGSFAYDPDTGFNGFDSFDYKAYDGVDYSNTATVVIMVRPSEPITILIPDHFQTIQEAIDHTIDGDTVLVADGTYTGEGNKNIDYKGMAITVRSANGPNSCILDCENDGRGFIFQSGEGKDSVLSGFTITNASAPHRYGGGIYCDSSSPTISNNIIAENYALFGGGIACQNYASPTIINNIIKGNTVKSDRYGGGINCGTHSSPLIINNIISNNFAYYGGGMFIWGSSSPTVLNNTFAYNSAQTVWQMLCGAAIQVAESSSAVITNSILWGDFMGTASHLLYIHSDSSATVTYCNIDQDGYGDSVGDPDGNGNMRLDPLFVLDGYWDDNGTPGFAADDFWVDGDYHLLSDSPCIDTGSNAPTDLPEDDIEGETRIFDGDDDGADTVDIGADEFVLNQCHGDFEVADGDVDGFDLAILADDLTLIDLGSFAGDFGRIDCMGN